MLVPFVAYTHWLFRPLSLPLQKSHSIWVERYFHFIHHAFVNQRAGELTNVALFKTPSTNQPAQFKAEQSRWGVFVEKNLPLLTGKSSMIFDSAEISASCRRGAEHWEKSFNQADSIVVFLSVKVCLCRFFQKLLRNFSVSESEAVFVCVARSVHIWLAQRAAEELGGVS